MHVVVNAAMSTDGKLSSRRRTQLEISGPRDFERVADLRAASDAVMVGIGTVLADDPSLSVDTDRARTREHQGNPPQPARIVADSRARTPTDADLLDSAAAVYVCVSEAAPRNRVDALAAANAVPITAGTDRVDLPRALRALEDEGIERLLVEGGGELIYSFFAADLVDELTVFVGSVIIGGRDAPTLVDGDGFVDAYPRLALDDVDKLDDGVLLRFSVPNRSP